MRGTPVGLARPLKPAARVPAKEPGELLGLSLVLPTYGEGDNIVRALEEFTAVLAARPELTYEIVVVDDDSPDRTWERANEAASRIPHIRVIRRQGERGLATAVVAGWSVSLGEVLAVMDADLQHPPELLGRMLDALLPGVDLVAGSRHIEGGGVSDWSIRRRVVSRGAQLVGLLILPRVVGRVNDPMSGCFLVRREALIGCELRPVGYKILIEVLAKARPTLAVREVPYVFRERRDGVSKVSLAVYTDYLLHLGRLRLEQIEASPLPYFALVGLGGIFLDMGLLYLLSGPLGWPLLGAKLAAAQVALTNNFFWHERWTFGSRQPGRTGQRFLKFQSICTVGMMLGVLVLFLLASGAGLNRYAVNLAAIAAASFWNYPVIRQLGWRTTAP